MKSLVYKFTIFNNLLLILLILSEYSKDALSIPMTSPELLKTASSADDLTRVSVDPSEVARAALNVEVPHMNVQNPTGAVDPSVNPINKLRNPAGVNVKDAEGLPGPTESINNLKETPAKKSILDKLKRIFSGKYFSRLKKNPGSGDSWFGSLFKRIKEALRLWRKPNQNLAIRNLEKATSGVKNVRQQRQILSRSLQKIMKGHPDDFSGVLVASWTKALQDFMNTGSKEIKDLEIESSMQLGLFDFMTKISQRNIGIKNDAAKVAMNQRSIELISELQKHLQARLVEHMKVVNPLGFPDEMKKFPWLEEFVSPEKATVPTLDWGRYEKFIMKSPAARSEYRKLDRLLDDLEAQLLKAEKALKKGENFDLSGVERRGDEIIARLSQAVQKSNGEFDTASKFSFLAIQDGFANIGKAVKREEFAKGENILKHWEEQARKSLNELLTSNPGQAAKLWKPHTQMVQRILQHSLSQ